jgi:ATP-dependent RNA helicase SUPV3L1/SUV3
VSQIKQIAGRAGRYGLHGDDTPGGFVTTMYPRDLPVLRDALATPLQPIDHVYLSSRAAAFYNISQALPPTAITQTVYAVHSYISKMRPIYRFEEHPNLHEQCQFIDALAGDLTMRDRDLMMKAPIPWKDPQALGIVSQFMRMHKASLRVVLSQAFRGSTLPDKLLRIERLMAENTPPSSTPDILADLESFHKVLLLYIWLSFRNAIIYCDQGAAMNSKVRVEKALDWCLKSLSWRRRPRTSYARPNYRTQGKGSDFYHRRSHARRNWDHPSGRQPLRNLVEDGRTSSSFNDHVIIQNSCGEML